jgi:hypothetical protein
MILLEELCASRLRYAQESAQVIKRDINAERLDKVTPRARGLRFAIEPKVNDPFKAVPNGAAAGWKVLLTYVLKNKVYTSVLSCLHKLSLFFELW